MGDVEGIKVHSASMNVGDMYPLFAALLTVRPWDAVCQLPPTYLHELDAGVVVA